MLIRKTADSGQRKTPRELHQKPLYSQKVAAWCAFSKVGIIRPYLFLKLSVDRRWIQSDMWLCFMTFFFPTWKKMTGIFHMSGFNRTETHAYTARASTNVIRETFAGRLISKNGDIPWSPRLPDHSPFDFFLWGYLKSKVYQGKLRTILKLKKAIQFEVAVIPFTMLTNVMRNFNDRLQECINVEGRHLPGTIFHK